MANSELAVETKSTRVYQGLRREIVNGAYGPGRVLVRRHLVQKYGVSLSIINEALARLVHDGLVESPENESTRVVDWNEEVARDNFALREAVERHVVRLLAESATAETLASLRGDARSLDQWLLTEEPNSILHLEFHVKLARSTGFRSLEETLKRTGVRALLTSRWLAYQALPHPPDFHEQLVIAIASRDPFLADAKIRDHLHFGLEK